MKIPLPINPDEIYQAGGYGARPLTGTEE